MTRRNALTDKSERTNDNSCSNLLPDLPCECLVQVFAVLLPASRKYEPISMLIVVANNEVVVSTAEDGTR